MTDQGVSFHEKQNSSEQDLRTRQQGESANNAMVQILKELCQTLCDDDGLNTLKIEAATLLHNLRVARSNVNQIKQVFLEAQTHLRELWMISSGQIRCAAKHELDNLKEQTRTMSLITWHVVKQVPSAQAELARLASLAGWTAVSK
jgi:hypothetical protein